MTYNLIQYRLAMSSPTSPTSPSQATATRRVNAVLPKASKQAIQLLLEIAAEKHSIDAQTVLALTNLLSDRQFALDFKTKQATVLVEDKERRAIAKEARLQKQADKLGITLEEHKASLVKD